MFSTSSYSRAGQWRNLYALRLHDFFRLRADEDDSDNLESDELSRVNIVLLRYEKKHKLKRWSQTGRQYKESLKEAATEVRYIKLVELRDAVVQYHFMVTLKRKYARGQSLAKRINLQVQAASKKVNQAVKVYNDVPPYGPTQPPHEIHRKEIMDLEAPFWHNLSPLYLQINEDVPYLIRRKLIDTWRLKLRAEEELQITRKDVQIYSANLTSSKAAILEKMESLGSANDISSYEFGLKAFLLKHEFNINSRVSVAEALLQKMQLSSDSDTVIGSIEDQLLHDQLHQDHHHSTNNEFVRQIEEETSDDELDETD